MRAPRFEVVRTDAAQPWHARFVAANGRIVWTTEQYARRAGAIGAIEALANATVLDRVVAFGFAGVVTEVRDVDERRLPPTNAPSHIDLEPYGGRE